MAWRRGARKPCSPTEGAFAHSSWHKCAMKAVSVREFSPDFEGVEIVDRPLPEPGPGQVRVRMRYAPIHPSDFNNVHGTYRDAFVRSIWNLGRDALRADPDAAVTLPTPPFVIGGEGVGIVDAAGGGLLASRLKGKRVSVSVGPPSGTWQEYTIAEAIRAVSLPASVSDQQASMFFVNPLSTTVMLKHILRVQRGEWLLITAGGSAIGKAVARLRSHFGYRVISVVRGDENEAELRSLGADVVVVTSREDLVERVREITSGRGARYAMDCVGGPLTGEVVQCMGMGGHVVVYGTLAGPETSFATRDLMMPTSRIEGFFLPGWLTQVSKLTALRALRATKRLVAAGMFEVPVAQTFALDDVVPALEAASARGRTGKVLLEIGG